MTEAVAHPTRRPARVNPAVNVLSNWGAFLFYSVAGFFISPFVVRSLGKDLYGTWVLIGSTVGYLGLLDLGVRGAVTRFIARLHAAGDHAEARRFCSAALFVFLCASAIAVVGGLALAAILPVFSIPAAILPTARVAVVLIACTIAVALPGGVYGGVVIALQRFDLSNAASVIVEALRMVTVILFLRAGYGLIALALIQLTAGVANLAFNFWLSRRIYPELRPKLRDWNRGHLREMIGYSLTTTALNGAGIVILQMDSVVIARFMPVAMVTYFVVAGSLTDYARKTVAAISRTVTPRISALEGAGESDRARRLPVLSARIATIVLLPIVITFLTRGGSFFRLWMGQDFVGPSGRVLIVLSLSLWLDAGRQVIASSLMGLNKHEVLIRPYVIEAVANLVLSVILVQRLGLIGVAIGTAVPRLIVSGGLLPPIFARALDVRLGEFWSEVWLRPTIAMVPFGVASWLVERYAEPTSFLVYFAEVTVLLPLAVLGVWLVAFTGTERSAARRRLAGVFANRSL